MAYPKEYCGCEVLGETRELQVINYLGRHLVIHCRTGKSLPIANAMRDKYIESCNYFFSDKDMNMLKNASKIITERSNPKPVAQKSQPYPGAASPTVFDEFEGDPDLSHVA